MPKYIFLDTWVLSDYTKHHNQHLLSSFIHSNSYTVIVNSISLVEMFNPGWCEAASEDRAARVAHFLSQHPSVVVYPQKVQAAEIQAYPKTLSGVPVELELDSIPASAREQTLLGFLRGDEIFARQGKDIKLWAENYSRLKAQWLQDVEQIIDRACQTGTLSQDASGNFTQLEKHKERFLKSLDRRHFTPDQIQTLGIPVIQLFMDDTAKLPSVRFTSLCFWYAYVNQDKAYPMKRSGSDIGDFYQMSLIPYCSAFTVDKTMYHLVTRILSEIHYDCRIFSPGELKTALNAPTETG